MKRLTGIFVLSKSEQRVIVIVVLALVVGALARYERRANHFQVSCHCHRDTKSLANSCRS